MRQCLRDPCHSKQLSTDSCLPFKKTVEVKIPSSCYNPFQQLPRQKASGICHWQQLMKKKGVLGNCYQGDSLFWFFSDSAQSYLTITAFLRLLDQFQSLRLLEELLCQSFWGTVEAATLATWVARQKFQQQGKWTVRSSVKGKMYHSTYGGRSWTAWLHQHSSVPRARCAANSWYYQNVLVFAPKCIPFSNKIRLCMKHTTNSQKTTQEYFYTLCFTYLRSPRSFRAKWAFQSL